jgi:hypothetical protein
VATLLLDPMVKHTLELLLGNIGFHFIFIGYKLDRTSYNVATLLLDPMVKNTPELLLGNIGFYFILLVLVRQDKMDRGNPALEPHGETHARTASR